MTSRRRTFASPTSSAATRRGARRRWRSGTASGSSRTRTSTSARTGSRRRCWRVACGAGTRVAYLDRSAPEVVELLFAASKAGAVLVPLNWRLAPPELGAVLADAEAPLLIAGPAYRAVAQRVLERLLAGAGPDRRGGGVRALARRRTSHAIRAAAARPAT